LVSVIWYICHYFIIGWFGLAKLFCISGKQGFVDFACLKLRHDLLGDFPDFIIALVIIIL